MTTSSDGAVHEVRRVVQNHTLDSTRWQNYPFRQGDIVIASWGKAGTTWAQQIVSQLVFQGGEEVNLTRLSPWIENRLYSIKWLYWRLEAQTHRRFVKTHLPADAVPLSALASYLYVCRDGRDVAWSWYNHHRSLTPSAYEVINQLKGRVGPPIGPVIEPFNEFFRVWLEQDGFPLWPFWSHVSSWWNARERNNVLLLHYEQLQADLPGQVRRVARFLAMDIESLDLDRIVHHCSFEYMRQHAGTLLGALSPGLFGGAQTFMRGGSAGSWRSQLSPENLASYEHAARKYLSPECVDWLHPAGFQ